MNTDRTPSKRDELLSLKADAEGLGFLYGMDFYIATIPGMVSSEVIILDVTDDEYVVVYSDMGRERELSRSTDLGEARTVFLEHLSILGASRERGPRAAEEVLGGRSDKTPEEAFRAMQEQGYFPDIDWDGSGA